MDRLIEQARRAVGRYMRETKYEVRDPQLIGPDRFFSEDDADLLYDRFNNEVQFGAFRTYAPIAGVVRLSVSGKEIPQECYQFITLEDFEKERHMKIELKGFAPEGPARPAQPVVKTRPLRLALVEDNTSNKLFLAAVDDDGYILPAGRLLGFEVMDGKVIVAAIGSVDRCLPVELDDSSHLIVRQNGSARRP